jgi:hypothetical protein
MADRQYYERINQMLDQGRSNLPTPPRRTFPPGLAAQLKRLLRVLLLVLIAALCLAYVVDFAQSHYRMSAGRNAFGSVTVDRFSAIPQKAPGGTNRTEFDYMGSENQTCLNSLFPHAGYTPCWYARRHTDRRVNY